MIINKRPKRPIRASLVRPVLARTGSGRRLDLIIIVLILVFGTTKNSSPEALLLLFLILVLGLSGILRRPGSLALGRDGTPTSYIRRRRGSSRFGFNAKNSLKNVAVVRLLTGLGGLSTVDKGGCVVVRAGRGGYLVSSAIQGQFNHALGRSERFCI